MAGGQPRVAIRISIAIWPAIAAFLAAISAVFGFFALINSPVVDPADLIGVDTGTKMLSEPYLDVDKINSAYAGRPPKAVSLAVDEFDSDASADLSLGTQDFQTRDAPDPLCADDLVRPSIIEVFGTAACERGSAFYTATERYERGLFWWVGHGDPTIGTALPLTKDEFNQAFTAMRGAETALVSCSVMNRSKIAVTVKVSPDSGMVPIDGQTEAVLDPGAIHAFLLKPAPGIAAPIGEQPECSFDRSIADKERDKPYPRWEIAVALVGALLAALTALYGAFKGKPS